MTTNKCEALHLLGDRAKRKLSDMLLAQKVSFFSIRWCNTP